MAAPTRSDFCTLDTKFGTILKSVAYNLKLTWTVGWDRVFKFRILLYM